MAASWLTSTHNEGRLLVQSSGVINHTRSVRWPRGQLILLFGIVLASGVGVAGCTSYESAYEEAVYDWEPLYCYQSLADVSCASTPNFRDERRLTSYYGPSPNRYDRPAPPPPARLDPPPAVPRPFVRPEASNDKPYAAPEPEQPAALPVEPRNQPETT